MSKAFKIKRYQYGGDEGSSLGNVFKSAIDQQAALGRQMLETQMGKETQNINAAADQGFMEGAGDDYQKAPPGTDSVYDPMQGFTLATPSVSMIRSMAGVYGNNPFSTEEIDPKSYYNTVNPYTGAGGEIKFVSGKSNSSYDENLKMYTDQEIALSSLMDPSLLPQDGSHARYGTVNAAAAGSVKAFVGAFPHMGDFSMVTSSYRPNGYNGKTRSYHTGPKGGAALDYGLNSNSPEKVKGILSAYRILLANPHIREQLGIVELYGPDNNIDGKHGDHVHIAFKGGGVSDGHDHTASVPKRGIPSGQYGGDNIPMNQYNAGGEPPAGLYDYLVSVGESPKFQNRKSLYGNMFSEGYRGTAEQNTKLRKILGEAQNQQGDAYPEYEEQTLPEVQSFKQRVDERAGISYPEPVYNNPGSEVIPPPAEISAREDVMAPILNPYIAEIEKGEQIFNSEKPRKRRGSANIEPVTPVPSSPVNTVVSKPKSNYPSYDEVMGMTEEELAVAVKNRRVNKLKDNVFGFGEEKNYTDATFAPGQTMEEYDADDDAWSERIKFRNALQGKPTLAKAIKGDRQVIASNPYDPKQVWTGPLQKTLIKDDVNCVAGLGCSAQATDGVWEMLGVDRNLLGPEHAAYRNAKLLREGLAVPIFYPEQNRQFNFKSNPNRSDEVPVKLPEEIRNNLKAGMLVGLTRKGADPEGYSYVNKKNKKDLDSATHWGYVVFDDKGNPMIKHGYETDGENGEFMVEPLEKGGKVGNQWTVLSVMELNAAKGREGYQAKPSYTNKVISAEIDARNKAQTKSATTFSIRGEASPVSNPYDQQEVYDKEQIKAELNKEDPVRRDVKERLVKVFNDPEANTKAQYKLGVTATEYNKIKEIFAGVVGQETNFGKPDSGFLRMKEAIVNTIWPEASSRGPAQIKFEALTPEMKKVLKINRKEDLQALNLDNPETALVVYGALLNQARHNMNAMIERGMHPGLKDKDEWLRATYLLNAPNKARTTTEKWLKQTEKLNIPGINLGVPGTGIERSFRKMTLADRVMSNFSAKKKEEVLRELVKKHALRMDKDSYPDKVLQQSKWLQVNENAEQEKTEQRVIIRNTRSAKTVNP